MYRPGMAVCSSSMISERTELRRRVNTRVRIFKEEFSKEMGL
jgi:hypothetical protein